MRCNIIQHFIFEEDGQTLVEYAMLIALLSIVLIVALTLMGKKTSNVFNAAGQAIEPGQNPKPIGGG